MGIFDKIKGMVGSEDLDYNDYDADLFGDDAPGADPMMDNTQDAAGSYETDYNPFEPQQQAQSQTQTQQPPRQSAPVGGSNLELKVVKPSNYENVSQIADHLMGHRTVVLNLEGTNKETARRLLDFLSGVAYSIHGQLKRVANNTFVITPPNVDVSGDPLRDPKPAPKPDPKTPLDEDDIYNNEI